MDLNMRIKNMRDFNGLMFFELVIEEKLGVRGWKIARDIDGNFELMFPQRKSKKGIYEDTSIFYDENTYDRILELALVELAKINGSNEVIE